MSKICVLYFMDTLSLPPALMLLLKFFFNFIGRTWNANSHLLYIKTYCEYSTEIYPGHLWVWYMVSCYMWTTSVTVLRLSFDNVRIGPLSCLACSCIFCKLAFLSFSSLMRHNLFHNWSLIDANKHSDMWKKIPMAYNIEILPNAGWFDFIIIQTVMFLPF